LRTRWVDSSSPFLNHSQWQIAVLCGGRSCLHLLQSLWRRLAESGLLNLASASKVCRSSPLTVGSLNRFYCWGVLVSGWSIFDLSFSLLPRSWVCISALLTVDLGGYNLIQ
jgi:hypothetical protein